jgi:hypothetical protein
MLINHKNPSIDHHYLKKVDRMTINLEIATHKQSWGSSVHKQTTEVKE